MVFVHKRLWPILGAASAIWLLASAPGWADVPKASYGQSSRNIVAPAGLEKLLSDAQRALANGDHRLALIYLKNAVSVAPNSSTARLRLATVLFQLGDNSNAEDTLRTARRNGAPDQEVLPLLFQVMLARGESQLLLDQFPDPAGAVGPASADILKGRAQALQDLKQEADALAAMDRSLSLRRDVPGLLARARLSMQQGDFAASARFVDEAVKVAPDNPDAILFKVETLLASKDNAAALDFATQAAEKFPKDLRGQFARVTAFLSLNQDLKAKAEVENILSKNPNMALGIFYKALILARAGDKKGAWGLAQSLPASFLDSNYSLAITVSQIAQNAGDIQTGASILARSLKNNPDQLSVRVRLAATLLRTNNYNSALNVLRPAQDSNDPRVLRLYSTIYLQMGRPKDSLTALKRLDASGNGDVAVKRGIALLELRSGNTDQAIADLTRAVEKEPSNASLVENLINALMQKQRFAEALKVSERLAANPQQLPTALAYRGAILFFQKNLAGAQSALDKAIALDPRNKSALYSRATLLESTRKYPEASRDLRAILSIDKTNVGALTKLAEVASRQGNDAETRALLKQAIALSPGAAAPKLFLVNHLISRRDFRAALPAANDCLRTQSDNAECVLLLARIQEGLGQKKEAVASFRRYVALNPTLASAYLELGEALARAGNRAGAEQSFNTAARLAPDVTSIKQAQINFQFDQGKQQAAVEIARSFQTSNPGPSADLLMADALERAGRSAEAEALLRKSLSDRPQGEVLMRLVRLALASNNKAGANELLSKWLVKNPNDREARLQYAAVLMQQDDNRKAISQYQMVLKQDPDQVIALNNLAWLIQGSDPKRAIALLTHALELSPNVAEVADSLGWLRLQQKDIAGGLKLLQRAHALRPTVPDITYHLIVALDANANRKAARELLDPLLASGVAFPDRPAALRLSTQWR